MDRIIENWIDSHEDELIEIASDIFNHPEIAYKEKYSSKRLADYLAANGFEIEWGVAGIETAFKAVWDNGDCRGMDDVINLGFLAEYDALPEMGHACGHNLLGTAVCAAACGTKAYLENERAKTQAQGRECTEQAQCQGGNSEQAQDKAQVQERNQGCRVRIIVFGCPAEEIMSGKIVMNDAGVFDDLSAAITWHPFDRNRVSNDIWPSIDVKRYVFTGLSAHAAMCPEEGRSALDAAELMNVGVNYLREHVARDVTMHYAYEDNGIPANVVPDKAVTNYFIRSGKRSRTEDASNRVDNCARGAALMTGTSVEIELVKSCKEMKVNRVLAEVYYEAMKDVPLPEYSEEELKLAAEITDEAGFDNNGKYFDGLEALEAEPVPIYIGTDASEVSHTVPLVTLSAATMCKGTPIHHWATAKQAACSIGHKGMIYAAKSMAEGTKLLLETPNAIKKALDWHKSH